MTKHQPQPSNDAGESRARRLTERLNMLMSVPMVRCIAELKRSNEALPPKDRIRIVDAVIAKMVLIALGDFHGVDGKIFPGLATIAGLAATSEKSAERAIQTLEAMGMIRVHRRNRARSTAPGERTNWYVLAWDRIEESVTGSDNRPTVGCHDDSENEGEGVTATDPRSVAQQTRGLLPNRPEVSCPTDPRSVKPTNPTAQLNRAVQPTGQKPAGAGGEGEEIHGEGGGLVGSSDRESMPSGKTSVLSALAGLQRQQKATAALRSAGVKKHGIPAALEAAAKADPSGQGDPLPRVLEVIDAANRKAEKAKTSAEIPGGGWIVEAIVNNWDVGKKPRGKSGGAAA